MEIKKTEFLTMNEVIEKLEGDQYQIDIGINELFTKGLELKINNEDCYLKVWKVESNNVKLKLDTYYSKRELKEVKEKQDSEIIDKVQKYMLANDYELNDIEILEELTGLYSYDVQFQEALDNNYSIWDYDNWKSLQCVMGIVLDYKTAINVLHVLNREDITIAELSDNTEEITKEKINEYYENDREYYDEFIII